MDIETLKEAVKACREAADLAQAKSTETNRLWCALAAALLAIMFLVGVMTYQTNHMQEAMDSAVATALHAVAEMEVTGDTTTTTTQSVEGDSAVFNNVQGEQYNDSAQKNGGDE